MHRANQNDKKTNKGSTCPSKRPPLPHQCWRSRHATSSPLAPQPPPGTVRPFRAAWVRRAVNIHKSINKICLHHELPHLNITTLMKLRFCTLRRGTGRWTGTSACSSNLPPDLRTWRTCGELRPSGKVISQVLIGKHWATNYSSSSSRRRRDEVTRKAHL